MSQDSIFHALAVLRDQYRSLYPVVSLSDELRRLTAMAEKALEDYEREDRA